MLAEKILKDTINELSPKTLINNIDSNLWDCILYAMEKYAIIAIEEGRGDLIMYYKILSNKGFVAGTFEDPDKAYRECMRLNKNYVDINNKFFVVGITPYRLYTTIEEAEKIHSFPYEVIDDKAVWYMSREEYHKQIIDDNNPWLIKYEEGTIVAEFDSNWYNNKK